MQRALSLSLSLLCSPAGRKQHQSTDSEKEHREIALVAHVHQEFDVVLSRWHVPVLNFCFTKICHSGTTFKLECRML
jgi:hypothetical protein